MYPRILPVPSPSAYAEWTFVATDCSAVTDVPVTMSTVVIVKTRSPS